MKEGKGSETITEKRVLWLLSNKNAIESSRTDIVVPARHNGRNAKGIGGMSSGGWGYWVWALNIAGIKCDAMPYWSGSMPTPSTAINEGIANYIHKNAPKELL